MASVQAFDLDAPEEVSIGEPVTEDDAGDRTETSQEEFRGGASVSEETTVDRDYVKSKLANRELREKEAARKFKIAGLVAGVVIVIGVVGFLIFGRG